MFIRTKVYHMQFLLLANCDLRIQYLPTKRIAGNEYVMHPFSKKFPHWSSEIIGSEDCLYLNVFTPTLNNNSNLSVFVWVMADIYNTVVETGMATTLTQSS